MIKTLTNVLKQDKEKFTVPTLTTESLAVFMPFRVQEVYDIHGIYYGQNFISRNMIIADRRRLLNGNSFILGVPGGGNPNQLYRLEKTLACGIISLNICKKLKITEV